MQETDTESAVELESATPSSATSGGSSPPAYTEDINIAPNSSTWSLVGNSNPRLILGSRVRFVSASHFGGTMTLLLTDASGTPVSLNRLFNTSSDVTTLDLSGSRQQILDVRTDAPLGRYQLSLRLHPTMAWQSLSDLEVISPPAHTEEICLVADPQSGLSVTDNSNFLLPRGSRVKFQNVGFIDIVMQLEDESGPPVSLNRLFDTSSEVTTLDLIRDAPVSLDVRRDAPFGRYRLVARQFSRHISPTQPWQSLRDIEVVCDPQERECVHSGPDTSAGAPTRPVPS